MRNRDVAEMLDRAARILSLRGENRYRVRAYKRASRAVASCPEEIEKLIQTNRLQSLEGVGAGLAAKIKEIVRTGSLAMLERVETGNLPEIDEGKQILLASALMLSSEIMPELEALPGIKMVRMTGDTRRRPELVRGTEIIVASDDPALARNSLQTYDKLHRLRWDGNFCRAVHSFGVGLTLYLVSEEDFPLTLWVTTGTTAHTQAVAAKIREVTGYDILSQQTESVEPRFTNEEDIYRLAGMPWIPPELRENRGEIEAALEDCLPILVQPADYQGDLHVHSDWSDGTAGVEKMVEAAVELGYKYIAVTDHSRSLKIARGLSLERLADQRAYIASLQKKHTGIRILTGIEADILDDGSVDAPDDILADLDVVVASIHSGFKQSREKMTARICRAMENPYVGMIGHATGRLLGKRDPYEVDMNEVIRVAAATGTALEINSSPDRLDINGQFSRQANEAGVMVAINTDAHSQLELANVILGISMARRGWLTGDHILNTKSAAEVIAWLKEKKKRQANLS
ncbi:MAG: PHP domain-containing protein [Bacillota bacterium]|nr:PHP domain-containing protein [Bacillota bacterium]MDW7684953.1 PHP domain-containing protein [Bacillota bacterium]